MEPFVQYAYKDGIATIRFFHPKSNSLPTVLLNELAAAFSQVANEASVNVVVLRSEGEGAFCAGASFTELQAINSEAEGTAFFMGFARVINAMRACGKLVIARIHGKCVGGGVGLAAAADYAIAVNEASVKLSELFIGIGPYVIGPAVQRKLGLSAFSSLAIDANNFHSAEWAWQKGLFNTLVNDVEQLDASVNQLAKTIAGYSSDATTALKEFLWQGTENWDDLLATNAAISGRLVITPFAVSAIHK